MIGAADGGAASLLADARPTLRTARLVLRPFRPDDGPDVERLAGARELADTTLNIRHPYPPGDGERWIAGHAAAWAASGSGPFAVCRIEDDALVGAVGLGVTPRHAHAELGYWVGVPYWGHGYATEAARALLALAFDTLGLHRVQAHHMPRNPASGRILRKLGMRREGLLREVFRKGDVFEDAVTYAILAHEWRAATGASH